ncbi:MAG: hypothetical protein ACR2OE_17030 [Thermomicrobiales bacterium]
MIRQLSMVLILILLGFGVIGFTAAQEASPSSATPAACATPAGGHTASPVSSPIAVDLGTPVNVPTGRSAPSPTILYPCGTPAASPAP